MAKYQIWMNLDLVGHITGENVTLEDAIKYVTDYRGEINPDDVEICEIPESYYRDFPDLPEGSTD